MTLDLTDEETETLILSPTTRSTGIAYALSPRVQDAQSHSREAPTLDRPDQRHRRSRGSVRRRRKDDIADGDGLRD
jgi:virulence-associated protein VagC